MQEYTHFIGVDISKDSFAVIVHCADGSAISSKAGFYHNNDVGVKAFSKDHDLESSFVVVEATGGYETLLINHLVLKGGAVHRISPRASHHYMRSVRLYGKTDTLDAAALAQYGLERHRQLPLVAPPCQQQQRLQQLMTRRDDLIAMQTAEKNRLQHPTYAEMKNSILAVLEVLKQQLHALQRQIDALIHNSNVLRQKRATLLTIPGIGTITAQKLLAFLPELGHLNRRQIASLAGVAPHPKQSGNHSAYQSQQGGRHTVKTALFTAALAARNAKGHLQDYFLKLVSNGKKNIVAIGALMRKLIVIANAKLLQLNLSDIS